ncbi:hypothetical protein J2T55_000735 [Methylohalomonas lacus]|uniref:Uncharacterized protein n=1 Tax=Methylohalomonas lacus TaxID=398773 RepID=A0AAE3HKC8_9GAMM|nr:hypothetical protein [Methylohalomonas lacus]
MAPVPSCVLMFKQELPYAVECVPDALRAALIVDPGWIPACFGRVVNGLTAPSRYNTKPA